MKICVETDALLNAKIVVPVVLVLVLALVLDAKPVVPLVLATVAIGAEEADCNQ